MPTARSSVRREPASPTAPRRHVGPEPRPDGPSCAPMHLLRSHLAGREGRPDPDCTAAGIANAGAPLEAAALGFMERRFGRDFRGVRVHADSRGAAAARAVQAEAFTLGRDIVFNAGRYRPSSPDGRRLIAHELAHVVQQGAGLGAPAVQRRTGDEPDEEEQRTSGLSCPLTDFSDPDFDEARSCCHRAALDRAREHLETSRTYLRRAIQNMASGARIDGVIATHFGASAVAQRGRILANLRTTLAAAERFDTPQSNPSQTFVCRPLGHSECQSNEHARAGQGTNITLCLNTWWLLNDRWTTVLHELFHYSGVALLPVLGESARPEDVASGRFETYHSPAVEEARRRDPAEIQSMEREDPSVRVFTRYPTAFSLENADSYMHLVETIGAETWSEEAASAWRYVQMPSLFFGSTVPQGEFTMAARLAFTPLGRGLHFITPGAVGIWTPGRGAVPLTDPAASETRGYLGGEVGLRGVFGGTVAGVFDFAGGAGARWTRGGDVEGAMHLRTSGGVRFGTPAFGASINVDLTRMFEFGREMSIQDGWILGGAVGVHWGGHSGAGR